MAVTVYKSNDPSAPLLQPTLGSYNNFLKAILVDGYGSKSAAGWTMPYDDIAANGQSIFANASGKHFLVQHDEFRYTNGTTAANYHFAFIRGCASYTDWNTTSGNFPNITGDANPDLTLATFQMLQHQLCTSNAFPTGLKWQVVADNKTVHIIIRMGSYDDGGLDPVLDAYTVDKTHNRMRSFGDYGLLGNSTHPYNSYIAGMSNVASTSNNNQSMLYLDYNVTGASSKQAGFIERNIAGDAGAVEFRVYPEINHHTNSKAGAILASLTPETASEISYKRLRSENEYKTSRILLYQDISAPENVLPLNYSDSCIGYYRGILALYNNTNALSEDNTVLKNGDTFISNGRTYYVILVNGTDDNSQYTYLFDLTGWD